MVESVRGAGGTWQDWREPFVHWAGLFGLDQMIHWLLELTNAQDLDKLLWMLCVTTLQHVKTTLKTKSTEK
jgi:hypothetical protein